MVTQQLGPCPSIYVTNTLDRNTITLQTFIHTDVIRCITTAGRRTIFDIKVAPRSENGELGLRVHLGLPAELLGCLAEIVNLSCDLDGLPTGQIVHQGRDIERRLNDWRPELQAGLTSTVLTENVATQAMWREVSRETDIIRTS